MKKSLLALVLAAPLTLGLSGCVISVGGDDAYDSHYNHGDREQENRKKIANLQLNSAFTDVRATLGTPDFNEVYQKEGANVQVLYYRTNRKHSDGMTTKDECTPLIFKDGLLVSWGETAYTML